MKSVFSRVMNWIAYTLILSFLPIIISFILAAIFEYDFTLEDVLADLFITACGFAVAILRDTIGSVDFVGHCIRYLMILACILSSVFFGGICIKEGEHSPLSPTTTENLLFAAVAILIVVTVFGIFTQIYMEWLSFHPNDAESSRRSELGK